MGRISVSARREPDIIKRLSKNISVNTDQVTALLPGNSIAGVLSRETNLNLRSCLESDIRDTGDTFVSNVSVMVDNFRLNLPDMAGHNFFTISHDQVEGVKVVRGAGAVLRNKVATGPELKIFRPLMLLVVNFKTIHRYKKGEIFVGQNKMFNEN